MQQIQPISAYVPYMTTVGNHESAMWEALLLLLVLLFIIIITNIIFGIMPVWIPLLHCFDQSLILTSISFHQNVLQSLLQPKVTILVIILSFHYSAVWWWEWDHCSLYESCTTYLCMQETWLFPCFVGISLTTNRGLVCQEIQRGCFIVITSVKLT